MLAIPGDFERGIFKFFGINHLDGNGRIGVAGRRGDDKVQIDSKEIATGLAATIETGTVNLVNLCNQCLRQKVKAVECWGQSLSAKIHQPSELTITDCTGNATITIGLDNQIDAPGIIVIKFYAEIIVQLAIGNNAAGTAGKTNGNLPRGGLGNMDLGDL